MGNLSEHFNDSEFACKCGCGFKSVSPELVKRLEVIRNHFGAPLIISSACRCPKHNAKVGGAKASQHLLGTAADINVKGVTQSTVWAFINETWPDKGGLGRYNSFTHIDVRPVKARWDMRK
ncbi:TPA: DUF882 domain-containing protein [Citrobacter freundii]|nr:DUF882 domain-containing protein [Citrobacter freundii]HAT3963847.1 DUF882 domain-containing protein [Citrobacter freundii]